MQTCQNVYLNVLWKYSFKGIVHPKMKILSSIFMLFQTHKTFVHLWNTNADIFDETFLFLMKAFWPCTDSNENTTFKTQKGTVVRILLYSPSDISGSNVIYEATRIHFVKTFLK